MKIMTEMIVVNMVLKIHFMNSVVMTTSGLYSILRKDIGGRISLVLRNG